jgi:predicted hotdog family 3-hydroxylacyl-ACP dehydratase
MELEVLLPHRAPMLLLERVVAFSNDGIECVVKTNDTPFSRGGTIDIVVATEWMAQAVGAYVGATRQAKGESPRIGFIIGSRRLDFHVNRVALGADLRVHVRPVWIDRGNGSFQCRVEEFGSGRILAEGSLTVHEPES